MTYCCNDQKSLGLFIVNGKPQGMPVVVSVREVEHVIKKVIGPVWTAAVSIAFIMIFKLGIHPVQDGEQRPSWKHLPEGLAY